MIPLVSADPDSFVTGFPEYDGENHYCFGRSNKYLTEIKIALLRMTQLAGKCGVVALKFETISNALLPYWPSYCYMYLWGMTVAQSFVCSQLLKFEIFCVVLCVISNRVPQTQHLRLLSLYSIESSSIKKGIKSRFSRWHS